MRHTYWLRIFTAFLLITGLFTIACVAGSVPKVTSMRTCTSVTQRPSQFEASGWTMRFNVGDTVYCVVKVDVPYDASRSSYDATIKWYTPNGDLYHEHDYKDLERGYIWSLWGSIDSANIAGQWRVTFSLRYATSRSVMFTVSGTSSADGPLFNPPSTDYQQPSLDLPSLPAAPPSSAPTLAVVVGREQEPNESIHTANTLTLDERVQGEMLYYSQAIYDQDWFSIYLPDTRKYWIEINAVGETSDWLSPANFVSLYVRNDAGKIGFSSYSSQKRNTESSTCDVVIPLTGPGKYYILLSTHDFEHNLVYSLQVVTTIPAWAKGKI